MSPEIWKDVVGYEGFYKVSSKGKIISVARYKKNHSKLQSVEEKEISQYLNPKNGYVYVYLCKNGEYKNKRLHRVVAEAFLPNKEGYKQINHKDGVRSNNSVDNLEWCNASYNVIDRYKRNGCYEKDKKIISLYTIHKNCAVVAKIVGMSNQGVQGVLKRNNVHIYSSAERKKVRRWLDE